jgi:hypothetical protein
MEDRVPKRIASFFEKSRETNKNDRQEIQMSADRLFILLHSLGVLGPRISSTALFYNIRDC